MTREKHKPKILKQELVAESRLFKVESLHLRFTNGTERIYEQMQGGHRGAVMLVPLLDVAPDWRHPLSGRNVAEMLAALPAAEVAEVKPL